MSKSLTVRTRERMLVGCRFEQHDATPCDEPTAETDRALQNVDFGRLRSLCHWCRITRARPRLRGVARFDGIV
jgi:hypothetical protein